jgi:hypothetical protein
VDVSGSAYVTGTTGSTDFPITPNAFQTTSGGSADAFVSKLNAAGSALLYSTYLGGSGNNAGPGVFPPLYLSGIAVDASGNAYVTGTTYSTDFPVTQNAFQTTSAGSADAFVSKLNATGSALLYSTYLGGIGDDYGFGLAVDTSGNTYVTGGTLSVDFPTTPGAFQTTFGGYIDAFVTKLNDTGSALAYSTYLGGSANDAGSGVAVNASGSAYVAGYTYSSDFPTTPGAFQTSLHPYQDAFVSKLNAAGSALVYSTYLGGNGAWQSLGDQGNGIAVDDSGSAYVTGYTASSDFPTTPGAFQTVFGGATAQLLQILP